MDTKREKISEPMRRMNRSSARSQDIPACHRLAFSWPCSPSAKSLSFRPASVSETDRLASSKDCPLLGLKPSPGGRGLALPSVRRFDPLARSSPRGKGALPQAPVGGASGLSSFGSPLQLAIPEEARSPVIQPHFEYQVFGSSPGLAHLPVNVPESPCISEGSPDPASTLTLVPIRASSADLIPQASFPHLRRAPGHSFAKAFANGGKARAPVSSKALLLSLSPNQVFSYRSAPESVRPGT